MNEIVSITIRKNNKNSYSVEYLEDLEELIGMTTIVHDKLNVKQAKEKAIELSNRYKVKNIFYKK